MFWGTNYIKYINIWYISSNTFSFTSSFNAFRKLKSTMGKWLAYIFNCDRTETKLQDSRFFVQCLFPWSLKVLAHNYFLPFRSVFFKLRNHSQTRSLKLQNARSWDLDKGKRLDCMPRESIWAELKMGTRIKIFNRHPTGFLCRWSTDTLIEISPISITWVSEFELRLLQWQ